MRKTDTIRFLILALAVVCLLVVVDVLRSPYRGFSEQYVALTQSLYPWSCPAPSSKPSTNATPALKFVYATQRLGKLVTPATSSLAAVDISGNGWDDLLIGTGNGRPQLLINTGGKFQNRSKMIAHRRANIEWHAHTAIDIDNDGRLDIASAGGGENGAGTHSRLLRNTTNQNRGLAFANMRTPPKLADQGARSRAILPVPAPSGERVDLYAAALHRDGHPNRYWRNNSAPGAVELSAQNGHALTRSMNDEGRGVFSDFDDDGRRDYLLIANSNAQIIWGDRRTAPTLLATQALSVAAGDLNNDGELDIYVGRYSPETRSDHVSFNDGQINIVLKQTNRVDHSELMFRSELSQLAFDLRQPFPRGQRRYPGNGSDIFLGRDRKSPGTRSFTLHKDDAIGKPENLRRAGIYIWYSDAEKLWHVRWHFQGFADIYQGTITGEGIADIQTTGFTREHPGEIADVILLNNGDGSFSSLCSGALTHSLQTGGVSLVDTDSDGWLDIAAVRRSEQGASGGEVFLLHNARGHTFERHVLFPLPRETLSHPDLIVHGFFDDDNRPDLVFTQGYGKSSVSGELTQLLLNRSNSDNASVTLDLIGRQVNAYALGARVTLFDKTGEQMGMREAGLNTNISQDTALLHFGLGSASGPWTARVSWPDATESTHTIEEAGYHRIRQPVQAQQAPR